MGCCQSDQHEQNMPYGRLEIDYEDVETCNYQSILTNASQEHLEDLEKYRNTFERAMEEIKRLGYDKTLINSLIESNSKIVTLFLHEKCKLKIKMLTLEKEQLRKCIEPLEHQLKACLFFNDKDDYMVDDDNDDDNCTVSALREANAETAYPRQNERHCEADQIADEETELKRIATEQENDPRYQSEQIFGKVIDQLVEEKHLLDERYAQIERKLDESSDNKVEIERLKCIKDELYRRSKMKDEELEDVKKDKTSFKDCVNYIVKKEPVLKNKLVNKIVDLQRRLNKANQYKNDVKQKMFDLNMKHSAEVQQLTENINRLDDSLKESESNWSFKYQTLIIETQQKEQIYNEMQRKYENDSEQSQCRITDLISENENTLTELKLSNERTQECKAELGEKIRSLQQNMQIENAKTATLTKEIEQKEQTISKYLLQLVDAQKRIHALKNDVHSPEEKQLSMESQTSSSRRNECYIFVRGPNGIKGYQVNLDDTLGTFLEKSGLGSSWVVSHNGRPLRIGVSLRDSDIQPGVELNIRPIIPDPIK